MDVSDDVIYWRDDNVLLSREILCDALSRRFGFLQVKGGEVKGRSSSAEKYSFLAIILEAFTEFLVCDAFQQ